MHASKSGMQVCETLDQRAGISESCMWPLLPPAEEDAAAEASAEGGEAEGGGWEDLPVEEQLSSVLDHVRERHFYCFFCGCQVRTIALARLYARHSWFLIIVLHTPLEAILYLSACVPAVSR